MGHTLSVPTIGVLILIVVDVYGRRILLLSGTAIMTLSLILLSIALTQFNEQFQGIMSVIAVLCFVIGFALGFGAVVWVILGEILPTIVRSRAMGFFMAISYLCNIFIATCTLTFIEALGSRDVDNPEKNGIAKMYLIFRYVQGWSKE